MSSLVHLQIRNPKDDETAIESATQIFSSILTSNTHGFFAYLFGQPTCFSFELFLLNQTLYYYLTVPQESETFLHSLMSSSYPHSAIQKTTDPAEILFRSKHISIGELVLMSPYYYPIKTYAEFSNIDPLAPVIGFLAKMDPHLRMGVQVLVTTPSFSWQSSAIALTQPKKPEVDPVTGKEKPVTPGPNASLVQRKAAFLGGKTCVRLVVATDNDQLPTGPFLQNLAGTYGGFSLGEGNRFGFSSPGWGRNKLLQRFQERSTAYRDRTRQILNAQELATLWHPPGLMLAGIKNIAWGKTLSGEPPENLPVADGVSEEERRSVNYFAKTEFKNKETVFGLKTPDRRRHVYIIGKTGAGKSTLIANMAIDDIRKDRGVGIVDPHGDLCDTILDYIPKRRMEDVIYLEPFDLARPFALNVLEIKNPQHKHLVASGIVSIFAKLYADSWGPRLEYILRNVILTLIEVPGSTLVDILGILSNKNYRKKLVDQVTDPVVHNFWKKEFDVMPDRMRAEAVSPIQNKVGQFVSARMIRNIIGHSHSSIDLEEIMNKRKILILNLSQGKLGEDNASLLGAMIITQIQLAAMQRSFIAEEDRQDFMLYVDEFQNFATSSFVKILSEARKYRLCLNLTNQYIDQLDETIRNAIFGNIGTLISFVVGASDADILSKEYGALYSQNDLVSIGKHEVIMKISIDNMMSSPFPAKTLPLPALKNSNREKIIEFSKERYGRDVPEDPPAPHISQDDEDNDNDNHGDGQQKQYQRNDRYNRGNRSGQSDNQGRSERYQRSDNRHEKKDDNRNDKVGRNENRNDKSEKNFDKKPPHDKGSSQHHRGQQQHKQ
ncbi:MAG: type IV secretion system DNA-binding domain-containing protein [Patescibacteria group bacterium]